jgi:hypothetical protein
MLGEIQAGPVFFPCQAETNGQSNAQLVQKRAAAIHPDWALERTKPAEPNEALAVVSLIDVTPNHGCSQFADLRPCLSTPNYVSNC